MSKTSERDIQALVSMMDEPDPDVYKEISARILSCGDVAMPFLEDVSERSLDEKMRQRVEILQQRIRNEMLGNELMEWVSAKADDLLDAWLLITKCFYPYLNASAIREQIQQIRKDIWIEMNDNLTALEQVKVFNHIFFETYKFKGNSNDYYNLENIFINKVLENRMGNPLSLSMLYMLIAREVDLPVRGINLPEHFVLAYMGERFDTESMKIQHDRSLFYINVFSEGKAFSAEGINSFLHKLGMEPLPAYFAPCSNEEIVIRMLNNILYSFDRAGQREKTIGLEALRNRLEKELL